MAFTAPTLFAPITPSDYVTEVNANFTNIQSAFNSIESELLSLSGGGISGGTNFGWLESMTKPDGVIGSESYVPRFSTDHQALYFDVPTKGFNDAVVLGSRRSDSSAWTINLTDRVAGLGDGTFRIAVQLKAQSAGVSSVVVEQADGATDETADLTLYDFDYVVSGGGTSYQVTNLRRVTHILASATLIDDLVDELVPLTFTVGGNPLTSTGEKGHGIHVPFNAEVVKAYASLGVAAGSTGVFDLVNGIGTDKANVLVGSFSFASGDGNLATKQVAGTAETTQVVEGDFIHLDVTTGDATADELTVTVFLRKLHHEIY